MTRISDDELAIACRAPDDDLDPWPASLVLKLATEVRERRAADLELDDYEAVNLLWLLRVARTINLDTGDWLGQLLFKLEKRGHASASGPNSGPRDTEMRLLGAARRLLGGKP